MDACLNSSERSDWQTPDSLLELVRQVGPIALDPCTTANNPCGALSTLVYPYGLVESWDAAGLVYVNPPYGRELPKWIDRACEAAAQGGELVLLTPARTDTSWFQRAYDACSALCFWRGRLRFQGAPASAPFPSALFYMGPRYDRFVSVFRERGIVVLR